MVERYNYSEGDECMLEDVHGAYVSYYDYADLEVENTKLEEALRECVEAYDKNMVFKAFPYNPFAVSIRKAREVLGDE